MNSIIVGGILLVFATLVTPGALAQTRFPHEGSRTLDTAGHPKAKGLELRIDFPASWSIEEAKRPNSVAIAVSKGGAGLQNCVLVVNNVDQLGWSPAQVQAETPQTFAERSRLLRAAEDSGGAFLDGGPAAIEALPSRWFEVLPHISRDGGSTVFPNVTYQVLYRHWLVTLTCGAGALDQASALTSFRAHSQLFRLIANSIVLPGRWKYPPL